MGCVMSFVGLCSCSGEEKGGEQGGEWISMMMMMLMMLNRTVLPILADAEASQSEQGRREIFGQLKERYIVRRDLNCLVGAETCRTLRVQIMVLLEDIFLDLRVCEDPYS